MCGKILNHSKLSDAPAGDIQLKIDCEPMANDFAAQPRNYPKARPEPYVVHVAETEKHWGPLGETLPGPVPDCPQYPAK